MLHDNGYRCRLGMVEYRSVERTCAQKFALLPVVGGEGPNVVVID